MNSEAMDKEMFKETPQTRVVLHILVVGFHHQRGAEVYICINLLLFMPTIVTMYLLVSR